MKCYLFNATVASLLVIVLITPSIFFLAPQRVHAVLGVGDATVIVGETSYTALQRSVNSAIDVIKGTITSIASVTSASAAIAKQVYDYVLQPLAFVVSGNLLKAITAGTIAFVIGKANGTGLPQFIADIQRTVQTVSDQRALALFEQYIRSDPSPYSGSIIAALSKEYLNKSSLLGFWNANMDTLRRTSPNPYGFLSGVWLPGNTATWFSLVTQTQNNPYSAYANAQSQLGGMLGPGVGAVAAKLQDIAQGGGFVSWCGSSDGFLGSKSTSVAGDKNIAKVEQAMDEAYSAAFYRAYDAAIADGELESQAIAVAKAAGDRAATTVQGNEIAKIKAANAGNAYLGVSPGDPCTNSDGTTGSIKTPGSVIAAGLNKVLGGQQDQVARMGNISGQINGILSNIATVLKTVQFASQILGGPGSGGLFGVDQPTPGQTRSALQAYANSPGNLGVTTASVLASAATLPSSGSDMLDRTAQYETAINTIGTAANSAATSVTSLLAYCMTQQQVASSTLQTGNPTDLANLTAFTAASSAQISAAQTAFGTVIAPVITRVNAASTTITNARTMVQKVQTELISGDPANTAAYTADIQALQTMAPTPTDLAIAQQDAIIPPSTTATVDPPGSLNISGGFLIERLNLLSTNAATLQPSCTAPAPVAPISTPIPTP